MLKLLPPHMLSATEIEAFVAEFRKAGEYRVPGGAGVGDMSGEEFLLMRPWLNYPLSYCFFAMNEIDEVIGVIRLTTALNEDSVKTGMYHIGLSVKPTYRQRGYGAELLRTGLKWLRSICEGSIAYCATKCEDEASMRTVEAAGGQLVRTRDDNAMVWWFDLREV